jgi:AmmeMemoRadiSam system protein B
VDERSQPVIGPLLRPLEVHRARNGVVVTDPLQLIAGQVFIPEGLLPIVGRLDGTRTIEDIESELTADGEELPVGTVADIVRQLDESLLLDGELFRNTLASTMEQFLRARTRPPAHAGSAGYPTDSVACAAALDAILGERPGPATQPHPRGLIAPHIDLDRGRAGYRAAYRLLAARHPADLYVVFGTGHQGPSAPVTGLLHDWETPVGTLRTDRRFVEQVHARLGEPAALDVFLHRMEHSVEFQALFLAHLLRDRDVEIAAFLCGALPSADGDPDGENYVTAILEAFEAAARSSGKRVCYLAGADLAHVGPAFGDPAPIDDDELGRVERDDRARLHELESGRPGSFHRAVEARGNPDRVCSATAIYLTARLAGGPARLLQYGQAPAADGSQLVTWCAATLEGA